MPTHFPPSFSECKFPHWQPQFQDAVLEFDPRKLPSLVETAATAIIMRLQSTEAGHEEIRALANAMHSLRSIQAKRLGVRHYTKRCA
jgi:hypothetical protein